MVVQQPVTFLIITISYKNKIMMTYKAPDGHIIESVPLPNEVTYSCASIGYDDGNYYSYEIKGAATTIGIQGIHINRAVDNNNVIITIKEFSDQELLDYQNENKPTEII